MSAIDPAITVRVQTEHRQAQARLREYQAEMQKTASSAQEASKLATRANQLQEQQIRKAESASESFRRKLEQLGRTSQTAFTSGVEKIEATRRAMLQTAAQAGATADQIDKINRSFDAMAARATKAQAFKGLQEFNKELATLEQRVSNFGGNDVDRLNAQRQELLRMAGHAGLTADSLDRVNRGFDTLIQRTIDLDKNSRLEAFGSQVNDLEQRVATTGVGAVERLEAQRKQFIAMGQAAGASAGDIGRVNKSFDTLIERAQLAEKQTGLVGRSLSNLRNVAVSVAAGILVARGVEGVFGFLGDIEERTKRLSQLGQVLPLVARTAGVTQQQLEGVERSILGMNLAAVEAKQVLATGLAAGLPVGSLTELTEAGRNLSVVMGGDIPTAVDRLVGAIVKEEVEILETAGLLIKFQRGYDDLAKSLGKTSNELTEQEKLFARYKQVIEASQSVTGAFEKSINTAGTQAALAATEWKNLTDEAGKLAEPALLAGYTTLHELLKGLADTARDFRASDDLRDLIDRAGVPQRLTFGDAALNAALGPARYIPKAVGTAYQYSIPGQVAGAASGYLGNPLNLLTDPSRQKVFQQLNQELFAKQGKSAASDAQSLARLTIKNAEDAAAAAEARRKAAEEAARKAKPLTVIDFEPRIDEEAARLFQFELQQLLRGRDVAGSGVGPLTGVDTSRRGGIVGDLSTTSSFALDPLSPLANVLEGKDNATLKAGNEAFEEKQKRLRDAFEEAQRQGEKTFRDLKRISNDWIRDLIVNGESFWSVFKQAGLTAFSDILSDVTARGLFNLFGGQSPGQALGGVLFGGARGFGGGGFGFPGAPGGTSGFAGPVALGLGAAGAGGGGLGGAATLGGLGAAGLSLGSLRSILLGGRNPDADIAGIGAVGGPFGGAGFFGSNLSGLIGGGLAIDGLRRGGLVGLGETTAGGALIGARFGGPVGAAIGAGVGAIAGTIRLFVKGAQEKAKEKIKSIYGVTINDGKVLEQITGIAKQQFGGSLDVAIHSPQIRDLIEYYNMATGGEGSGFGNYPRGVSIVQRQGQAFLDPQYRNATPFTYASSLPTAPASQFRQVSVIQISPEGVRELLATGTKEVISKENALVMKSSLRGLQHSGGRRDSFAAQAEPYAVTS